MPATQLTKAWSINANVRNAYVSLTDMAGWWIFQNHTFLLTKGWIVKFTSNGVTGPANGADTTDRIISNAAAGVRGASAGVAQSWTALQNTDGVQILFAYQGATDNIIRVSYSPGGLFTLAGTTTFQPTASDEVVISTGNDVVGSGTTLDRVMQIWASDDSKHWSNIVCRNNAMLSCLGIERINSFCGPGVFGVPYVGYRYNSFVRAVSPGGNGPVHDASNIAVGTAAWFGTAARVFTNDASRLVRVGAGDIAIGTVSGSGKVVQDACLSNAPAANMGMPLIPPVWSGENSANLFGILGYPTDFWVAYSSNNTTTPGFGDFMPGFEPGDNPNVDVQRTNWLVALGPAFVRPWRNAAATLEII